MDISLIALQGLQQASTQLDRAASHIASFATSSAGGSTDSVDLSAEMVALLSAKSEASANAATMKVANEISKSAVDMMA